MTGSLTTASELACGLVPGLDHAVEADHPAAVSTIVSERIATVEERSHRL